MTLAKTETYTEPIETYTEPMKKRRLAQTVALLLLVTASGFTGVTAQALQRAVWVTVLDKSGAPVSDLAPTDIIIREDNVTREILRIARATESMQISILVDNSEAAKPYISSYRKALPAFINALTADAEPGSRHEITIVALAQRPIILGDYTADRAQALKATGRLFSISDSGTYLLDGITEVSQGIVKRGALRPVIVAITTTEGPELSNRNYPEVLAALEVSGAALHVVTIGRAFNQSVNTGRRNLLSDLPAIPRDRNVVLGRGSQRSGGSYDTLLTGTALTGKLKRLAAELTHQYRVTYARPNTLIPPERVTVVSARPDLTVRGTAVDDRREQGRP